MGAQEAAGLFSHLAAQVPLKLDFQGMTDLSPDATTLLAAICLAQVGRLPLISRRTCRQYAVCGSIARAASGSSTTALAIVRPRAFDPH